MTEQVTTLDPRYSDPAAAPTSWAVTCAGRASLASDPAVLDRLAAAWRSRWAEHAADRRQAASELGQGWPAEAHRGRCPRYRERP
jgi:hypothetical protein